MFNSETTEDALYKIWNENESHKARRSLNGSISFGVSSRLYHTLPSSLGSTAGQTTPLGSGFTGALFYNKEIV